MQNWEGLRVKVTSDIGFEVGSGISQFIGHVGTIKHDWSNCTPVEENKITGKLYRFAYIIEFDDAEIEKINKSNGGGIPFNFENFEFLNEITAILSTTVIPEDGFYIIETVDIKDIEIQGVPHYIGHPSTKAIVEQLGAVSAESKLFAGLKPGESAICFAIKQGLSSRSDLGKTVDQEVTADQLSVRKITRKHVKIWICPFCGHQNFTGHICSDCGEE